MHLVKLSSCTVIVPNTHIAHTYSRPAEVRYYINTLTLTQVDKQVDRQINIDVEI